MSSFMSFLQHGVTIMVKKNIESSEEGKQIWWNLQYACQDINSYHNRNGFEKFPLIVTSINIGHCKSCHDAH